MADIIQLRPDYNKRKRDEISDLMDGLIEYIGEPDDPVDIIKNFIRDFTRNHHHIVELTALVRFEDDNVALVYNEKPIEELVKEATLFRAIVDQMLLER